MQQCPASFFSFRFSDGVDYKPSKYSFHSSERLFCDHLRPIGNSARIGCAKAGSCDVFGQKKDTAVAEIGPIRRESVKLCHESGKKWHSSAFKIFSFSLNDRTKTTLAFRIENRDTQLRMSL